MNFCRPAAYTRQDKRHIANTTVLVPLYQSPFQLQLASFASSVQWLEKNKHSDVNCLLELRKLCRGGSQPAVASTTKHRRIAKFVMVLSRLLAQLPFLSVSPPILTDLQEARHGLVHIAT